MIALRLRLAPHRADSQNSTEILADCAIDHPFYVKDKGWCSAQPGLSMRKYTIPFVDLSVGDVCLPPNHPEAVRTPTGDICDRFRRFEFDEQVRWSSKINAVDVRYSDTVKKLELTS